VIDSVYLGPGVVGAVADRSVAEPAAGHADRMHDPVERTKYVVRLVDGLLGAAWSRDVRRPGVDAVHLTA
jgi:hypothetical protein